MSDEKPAGGDGAIETFAPAPTPQPAATDISSWPMWVLSFVVLADQLDVAILRGVLEELRREFDLSDPQLAILVSAYTVVNALVAIPAGYLADRWKRTKTVGYSLIGWSSMTALSAAAPNYGTLVAVRAALGFQALSEPANNSLMADYYPPARRSRAFSIQQVMLVSGSALGIGVGGVVASALGWRWAFLIVGSPSIVVALLVLRLREPARGMSDRLHLGIAEGPGDAPPQTPVPSVGFGEFIRDMNRGLRKDVRVIASIPTMRYMLVGVATLMFAFAGFGTWMPSFYERQLGAESGAAQALVGAVILLGGVPGVLLGGVIGDRYCPRIKAGRVVVPAICLMSSVVFLTLAWIQTSVAPAFVFTLMGFVPVAVSLPIIRAGVSDAVPADLRGAGFGAFQLTVVLLGYAMGPLVIGFLSGAFDDNLRTAFLIVMPTILLGGLIMLRARGHYEQDTARIFAAIVAAAEENSVQKERTDHSSAPSPTSEDT